MPAEEEGTVREVSETEVREREEERGAGTEEPGGGELPLFLNTPDFVASAGEE